MTLTGHHLTFHCKRQYITVMVFAGEGSLLLPVFDIMPEQL